MNVGFFGLGNMGGPMARNLLKAGYKVKAFDVVSDAVKDFISDGGEGAETIKDAARDVHIIISMLPSGSIVKDLYLGKNGILKNANNSTLLIDSSTISGLDAKEVAERAKEKGFSMVDAPVSGGVSGAISATLSFIVGGPNESFEKAKPVLEKMGTNIFHAGPNGAGQIAKICNNMLLAIHMIGSSEALNLGMAHDLDPKVLSEIMKKSSGDNWTLQKYNPVPGVMEATPSSKSYEGGFGAKLMLKDLGLSQDAALDREVQTPLGRHAMDLYTKHCENDSHLDFSSIINFLKG